MIHSSMRFRVLFISLLYLSFFACQAESKQQQSTQANASGSASSMSEAKDQTPTWGVARLPDGHSVSLELAITAEQKAKGYMFREHVSNEEGMLFIYEQDGFPGFWMRNCRVALDIIWLDHKGYVVDIASDQQPCEEEGPCPSVSPKAPARYVLELAAGQAAVHQVETGSHIALLLEGQS